MKLAEWFSVYQSGKYIKPVYSLFFMVLVIFYFYPQQQIHLPPTKVAREFRAAWVATVANINWPSEPGLSVEKQKQQAIDILDALQANNFNAVIFQVRPQSDAFYQSEIEPWSYFLTGEQGRPPLPFYDPLEFWINEAHKRGLELHAWLNPYRAHHIKGGEVSEYSVVNTHPELVVQLAMGYHWLIPTKQETIDYSLNIVMDIVKRYQVDGIHFDDYFYPYPSYNNDKDFPDTLDYKNYSNQGGDLSRNDWRRKRVNDFVQRVYKEIKAEKNYVKFGISPFGIWRPGFPESIEGFDQYEKLFADAKLWLNEGWIDYFVPQLYWEINQYPQSFPILLSWWEKENIKNRHLWPGINTRQAKDEKAMDETINQIMISRGMLEKRPGNVFWNVDALKENPSFSEMLTTGPYKQQALVPSSTWLDPTDPQSPQVHLKTVADKLVISWEKDLTDDISHWVVYLKYADQWQYKILAVNQNALTVDRYLIELVNEDGSAEKQRIDVISEIAVTAIGRNGNESSWQSSVINSD